MGWVEARVVNERLRRRTGKERQAQGVEGYQKPNGSRLTPKCQVKHVSGLDAWTEGAAGDERERERERWGSG